MLKHGVEKQTKTGCSQIFPIGSTITIRWIEEGLKHFEERRNFPKLNIFFYSKLTRKSFISMLYSNWNSITQKCQNKSSTYIQSRNVTKKKKHAKNWLLANISHREYHNNKMKWRKLYRILKNVATFSKCIHSFLYSILKLVFGPVFNQIRIDLFENVNLKLST